jgi:hypothetical protein
MKNFQNQKIEKKKKKKKKLKTTNYLGLKKPILLFCHQNGKIHH